MPPWLWSTSRTPDMTCTPTPRITGAGMSLHLLPFPICSFPGGPPTRCPSLKACTLGPLRASFKAGPRSLRGPLPLCAPFCTLTGMGLW